MLLLWSGEPGVSAERICLPFPRPGARDRGKINAAPVASVYLDLFCKVWFWREAEGKDREASIYIYDVHTEEGSTNTGLDFKVCTWLRPMGAGFSTLVAL